MNTTRRGLSRLATARQTSNTSNINGDDDDDDDDDDDGDDFAITEDAGLRQSCLTYTILQACVNGDLDTVRQMVS